MVNKIKELKKMATIGLASALFGLSAYGVFSVINKYGFWVKETHRVEDFNNDGREDVIVYNNKGYPVEAFMQTQDGNYEKGRYKLHDGYPFVTTKNKIYRAGEREPIELSDLTR